MVNRYDEEVEVILSDGFKVRFFVLNLDDGEYISRAVQIRRLEREKKQND